jgi:Zn-dependent protease
MFNLDLTSLLYLAIIMVVSLTVHEFAHAWTADQLGDDTPRLNGRLTLNPIAHLDPIGSLMLLIAGFGWAKPVPVNPYAIRRRTQAGLMLVAAAGPFSNLLMAILAALPFRLGLFDSLGQASELAFNAATFLILFMQINLVLLFFNLIPVFPLDGEKVADYFLPASGQDILHRLRPYGPVILMGLILFGRFTGFDLLGILIQAPSQAVLNLLVF